MSEPTQALTTTTGGALAESHQAKTAAIWAQGPQSNKDIARALAIIGQRYDLDPALGEISIMGNRVYITIEGYLRIAEQQPEYEGYELWPLSKDERIACKAAEDEHGWGCKVYRRDRRAPSVGYGFASERTVSAGPLKAFAREIAQKRAMHRALRGAFRASLPEPDQAIDDQQAQGPRLVEPSAAPPQIGPAPDWAMFWRKVKAWGLTKDEVHYELGVSSVTEWNASLLEALDKLSLYVTRKRDEQRAALQRAIVTADAPTSIDAAWEPTDAEFHELEPDATEVVDVSTGQIVEPDPLADLRPTIAVPATPGRDPSTIKNWGQLYTACQEDFHLGKSGVLKALGHSQQPQGLIDFAEAYAQIREMEGGRLV